MRDCFGIIDEESEYRFKLRDQANLARTAAPDDLVCDTLIWDEHGFQYAEYVTYDAYRDMFMHHIRRPEGVPSIEIRYTWLNYWGTSKKKNRDLSFDDVSNAIDWVMERRWPHVAECLRKLRDEAFNVSK